MNKYVIISYHDKFYNKIINKKSVKKWVKKIYNELNIKNSYCSIMFTDNNNIKKINNKYFKKNYPTDVISFSQIIGKNTNFTKYNFIGDIVISIPFAKNSAIERNLDHKKEILYLIIHGILHLLGYDHEKNKDNKMFNIQDNIFYKITGEKIG